jgi:DNA repair photolyase
MNPEFIHAKSILSPIKNGPDKYFGIAYNMNIYRGCQHGCIYCDTRSKLYNIGNLSHIRIKENSLKLLEINLRKIKNKNTVGTGSMNDPYMPIEKEYNLVGQALEIIEKYKFPIHIITKSNLVLRDAETIQKISETYAAVSFTITTTDDELSEQIEPGAPVSSERFLALRALSNLGIYSGVIISPVLPFLTDSENNIKKIIHSTAKAGGKYILAWMGLTQREGQREYFYNELMKKFPGLEQKYHQLFGLKYNCPSPNADKLYDIYFNYCKNYGIDMQMKHYCPPTDGTQLQLF